MKKYFLSSPLPTPKIADLRQDSCKDSRFIKPVRLFYKQDGIEKSWDIIHSHDSVSIMLYEIDLDAFVIVKQFRPAVFMRNNDGYIYELCAGLVDKSKKTLEEKKCLKSVVMRLVLIAWRKLRLFIQRLGLVVLDRRYFLPRYLKMISVHLGAGLMMRRLKCFI